MSLIDLTGQKFERLTVIKYIGNSKWLCQCNCGKFTTPIGYNLRKGLAKSCGCLARENIIKSSYKHGCKHTKLYDVWCGIKDRCYNKNAKAYIYYGARGITICDEWKNNFINFKNWAEANGYKEGLSIERKDVNSDYCPENCCFISLKEQSRNKTNTLKYEYNGKLYTLTELSEMFNISYDVLFYRLAVAHWNLNDAISREIKNCPLKKSQSNHRYIYKQSYGYSIVIKDKYYGHRVKLEDAIVLRNKKLQELRGGK